MVSDFSPLSLRGRKAQGILRGLNSSGASPPPGAHGITGWGERKSLATVRAVRPNFGERIGRNRLACVRWQIDLPSFREISLSLRVLLLRRMLDEDAREGFRCMPVCEMCVAMNMW